MINKVFVRASLVARRLETGPLGSHLNSLAADLLQQRYSTATICQYLRESDAFGRWLAENNLQLSKVNEATIEYYLNRWSAQSESPTHNHRRERITTAIHALLRHLRGNGVLDQSQDASLPVTEVQQWLMRYQQHLENVQGLALGTRQNYVFYAGRLLHAHSQSGAVTWSTLTADRITAFVQRDSAPRQGFGPHATATAVRSLLRFLVSQGVLSSGLETAIPTIRRWSQAALPQRLSETEIARLLTICADGTAIARRNYAILLLLSRLGLRAKEVVRLQLNDVGWVNGSLLVRPGKTHCERILPLAQDVGEALLSYLQNERPVTSHRNLFLVHKAPYRPLQTAQAITMIVTRLLAKAGIVRRSSGAHLFRHTAATQMVNRGASFKDVADVLGHQSLQTTGIYAKLDLVALSQVALPWPGGA